MSDSPTPVIPPVQVERRRGAILEADGHHYRHLGEGWFLCLDDGTRVERQDLRYLNVPADAI